MILSPEDRQDLPRILAGVVSDEHETRQTRHQCSPAGERVLSQLVPRELTDEVGKADSAGQRGQAGLE